MLCSAQMSLVLLNEQTAISNYFLEHHMRFGHGSSSDRQALFPEAGASPAQHLALLIENAQIHAMPG